MTRKVNCIKLGQELDGLEKAPFPGDVGQQIYDQVSKQAWEMWEKDMQIKVINEYRLNMGDKEHYQMLVDQMMAFLNLSNKETLEVENEKRGRGE